MTPQDLVTSVSSGKFAPAYYFHGTEDYRMIEAEKFLAHQYLPAAMYQTNYRRLDGKRTSCANLTAELAVYPMLGERQLFAVTDFQHYKPTEVERILKLIVPGDQSRIIVFSSPSEKNPKRDSAFLKTVTKVATVVEFKKLSATEAAGTIQRKLAKFDVKIEREALKLLVDLVAGNRGAIETETDKLIDLKGKGSTITIEDVRSASAGYWTYSIFEIGDRVVSGDTAGVLRFINTMIAEGNNPTAILYFLSNHFISLYLVKNGKPLEPYRRWLTGKFRTQSEQYDSERLEQILIELADTDAQLRRSPVKPEFLLESLALRLTAEQKKKQ
jgi:DNA polymerase-3 subunit delta